MIRQAVSEDIDFKRFLNRAFKPNCFQFVYDARRHKMRLQLCGRVDNLSTARPDNAAVLPSPSPETADLCGRLDVIGPRRRWIDDVEDWAGSNITMYQ